MFHFQENHFHQEKTKNVPPLAKRKDGSIRAKNNKYLTKYSLLLLYLTCFALNILLATVIKRFVKKIKNYCMIKHVQSYIDKPEMNLQKNVFLTVL